MNDTSARVCDAVPHRAIEYRARSDYGPVDPSCRADPSAHTPRPANTTGPRNHRLVVAVQDDVRRAAARGAQDAPSVLRDHEPDHRL